MDRFLSVGKMQTISFCKANAVHVFVHPDTNANCLPNKVKNMITAQSMFAKKH